MKHPVHRVSALLRKPHGGFSLVELMITTSLGLIIMAGLLAVCITVRKNFVYTQALSVTKDNLGVAANVLSNAIRMAGYSGCLNTNEASVNILSTDVIPHVPDQGGAVRGYNGASGGGYVPLIPAAIAVSPRAETDAITVQYMSTEIFSLKNNMFDSSDDIVLQGGYDYDDSVRTGRVMVISDCSRIDVFTASAVSASGDEIVISHGPANNTSKMLSDPYSTKSQVGPLESLTYFINENTSGRPFLARKDNTEPGAEVEMLVPDVEALELTYGVHGASSTAPEKYVSADQVASDGGWENVVSVKVDLLGRSRTPMLEQPQTYTFNNTTVVPTDRYLRVAYSRVVALRNRGGKS